MKRSPKILSANNSEDKSAYLFAQGLKLKKKEQQWEAK